MYRRYNLLFYSQFSCAIASFLFSNISVSFRLPFSMYFLSSEDGLNDLSMSIGSTRYYPDSLRTRDRTTYSQFLNIVASPPVGNDDTTITSFDTPCNLCPVVASLIFSGICIILQQNSTFLMKYYSVWWKFWVSIVPVQDWISGFSFCLIIDSSIVLGWIGDVCGVDFSLLLNPVGM